LKSVISARRRSSTSGVSRQEQLLTPPANRGPKPCVLPKEPSDQSAETADHGRDGALINSSSTFGTLLSSQGSRAHLRRSCDLALGQPDQTYRVGWRPSNPAVSTRGSPY
jgi:hypothetical protein